MCLPTGTSWVREGPFSGVTCTDGRGSARTGVYAEYSDAEMTRVRVHKPRPRKESVIFDDVLPDDLPKAELTENARIVLGKRYLKKNESGEPVEDAEVMFWRVARTIAAVDADYGASESAVDEAARHFYDLMINGKFEPNSPTFMNAR